MRLQILLSKCSADISECASIDNMCAASKAIFDLDKDGGCDFDGDDSGSYSRDAVSTDFCLFFFCFLKTLVWDPPHYISKLKLWQITTTSNAPKDYDFVQASGVAMQKCFSLLGDNWTPKKFETYLVGCPRQRPSYTYVNETH